MSLIGREARATRKTFPSSPYGQTILRGSGVDDLRFRIPTENTAHSIPNYYPPTLECSMRVPHYILCFNVDYAISQIFGTAMISAVATKARIPESVLCPRETPLKAMPFILPFRISFSMVPP